GLGYALDGIPRGRRGGTDAPGVRSTVLLRGLMPLMPHYSRHLLAVWGGRRLRPAAKSGTTTSWEGGDVMSTFAEDIERAAGGADRIEAVVIGPFGWGSIDDDDPFGQREDQKIPRDRLGRVLSW